MAIVELPRGGPGVDEARVVEFMVELCRTESAPFREGAIAALLRERLARLGFDVVVDGAAASLGGETGNLVARRPGRGAAAGEAPLLFSAHMDRVGGGKGVEPVLEGRVLRSGGTTVLGADDAAGLAAILEACTVLEKRALDHPPLELVFTVGEEACLAGAKHFDPAALGIRSRCGFVVDAEGPVGSVVVSAPASEVLTARVRGCQDRAGAGPAKEKGTSAVRILAAAVRRMRLGRVDAETTASVAYVAGGGRDGGGPGRGAEGAEFRAEVRGLDPQKVERQIAHMAEALRSAAAEGGARVVTEVRRAYDSFGLAPGSEPVRRAARAVRRIGRTPVFSRAGGGSDANVFNAKGIECAALGVGYRGIHTYNECMPVDELVALSRLLVELMRG